MEIVVIANETQGAEENITAKRATFDVYGGEFRLRLTAMGKPGRRFANVLLFGLMIGLMGLVLNNIFYPCFPLPACCLVVM